MLLDVSPDQSMMDEGVAREVINRIQKLRKKVGGEKSPGVLFFIVTRLTAQTCCRRTQSLGLNANQRVARNTFVCFVEFGCTC